MTVGSSMKVAIEQGKYYNMAVNEDVVIENDKNMFHLICRPVERSIIPEQPVLEPDDDLRSAITMDELLVKVKGHIHKLYAV